MSGAAKRLEALDVLRGFEPREDRPRERTLK